AVPPPPRTQSERITRLEEEVHGSHISECILWYDDFDLFMHDRIKSGSKFSTIVHEYVTEPSTLSKSRAKLRRESVYKSVKAKEKDLAERKEIDNVGRESTIWKSGSVGVLKLQDGDYDLWSMRMEQYLTHTDYALWEVIVNGDAPVVATASCEQRLLKFHRSRMQRPYGGTIKTSVSNKEIKENAETILDVAL
ncbi:hypothetical protein Tco_0849926, partial [Tanacetum coccineum]